MATHFKGPPGQANALDSYIKLMRASHSVTARIHRHLSECKLTISQFGVLDALYHLGPLFQRDLAKKHLMSDANITMVVDNLEKRSLVRRVRRLNDRRFVNVHLTKEGTKLFEEIFPRHVLIVEREMSILDESEQEQLGRLCRKLGLRLSD
jgi:MarR family 2-MHQ and catechol resistance regulon transcriptional repressor